MIGLGRSILETSPDVLGFKIGIVFEDFLFGNSGCEEVQYVHDTDAHSPDAWATTALFRVERDSIHVTHVPNVTDQATAGEPPFKPKPSTISFGPTRVWTTARSESFRSHPQQGHPIRTKSTVKLVSVGSSGTTTVRRLENADRRLLISLRQTIRAINDLRWARVFAPRAAATRASRSGARNSASDWLGAFLK